MDRLATPLLAPLLIMQAVALRRRALHLPEPPGPREGTAGTGPERRLLILGDSSAAGVGAPHQDEALSGQLVHALQGQITLHWRLNARTGATSHSTVARLTALPRQSFDTALLVLGVNDVTSFARQSRVLADRARIAEALTSSFGVKRLLISGIPPLGAFPLLPQPLRAVLGARAHRLDTALATEARAAGHTYLPFGMELTPDLMAPDGFHPSPTAYRQWAETLVPHILG